MISARFTALCAISGLLLTGCSKLPTAPTSSAPQVVVNSPSQVTAPIPPRLTINQPRGIGLTRFIAFGDSITWGVYSSYDEEFLIAAANGGYPERLHVGLNAYHAPQQFVVFNEGLPGEMVTDPATRPRLQAAIRNRQAQAVLLLEGINDLNNDVGVSRTTAGLSQLISAATSMGVPVLVATMFQTYESTSPNGVERPNSATEVPVYNAQVRQLVAGRLNVHLVDLEPVMRNRAYVGNDGLHLTDAGFEVLASTFLAAIERAFPVRGSFQ
jgi:lysophospholipase L1-like esterase